MYPYYYAWKNNSTRAAHYGCACRVTARGKMNTIRLEFKDGRVLITSGNSIRRAVMAENSKIEWTNYT